MDLDFKKFALEASEDVMFHEAVSMLEQSISAGRQGVIAVVGKPKAGKTSFLKMLACSFHMKHMCEDTDDRARGTEEFEAVIGSKETVASRERALVFITATANRSVDPNGDVRNISHHRLTGRCSMVLMLRQDTFFPDVTVVEMATNRWARNSRPFRFNVHKAHQRFDTKYGGSSLKQVYSKCLPR